MITTFVTINLPVPPMLEEAVGYVAQWPHAAERLTPSGGMPDGSARYVAFYWEPAGDEIMLSDGRLTVTGDPWAWLTFVQHPTVAAALYDVDLGSSEAPATHWLILDREQRVVMVSERAAAHEFIAAQHVGAHGDAPAVVRMTADELNDWMREMMERTHFVSPRDVDAEMDRQTRLTGSLANWLAAERLSPSGVRPDGREEE